MAVIFQSCITYSNVSLFAREILLSYFNHNLNLENVYILSILNRANDVRESVAELLKALPSVLTVLTSRVRILPDHRSHIRGPRRVSVRAILG